MSDAVETEGAVLAGQLADAGLWHGLPEVVAAAEYARVAEGGYPFTGDALADRVMFHADGEDLAEFAIERFLQSLAPVLVGCGVVLRVETIEPEDWGVPPGVAVYPPMIINGQRVWFIDHHEGQGVDEFDHSWYLATVRPLALVNRWLEAAGAAVRFHTLNAGTEDGFALLIDPRAAAAVRASGKWRDDGTPQLAVDNRTAGS